MAKHIIQVPLYHCAVVVCDDPKEQPFPDNEFNQLITAGVWAKNGDIYVTFDKKYFTVGRLAHECLHAAHRIFMLKNIDADVNHDEHTAYLVEYLSDEIYTWMRDTENKNGKGKK